jgi:hypothetical protein
MSATLLFERRGTNKKRNCRFCSLNVAEQHSQLFSFVIYDLKLELRSHYVHTKGVRQWFGQGMAVSSNNKLWDRANYHRIVQSQYIFPPPNGFSRACLWKTAASLPIRGVVDRSRKNGRRLSWAQTHHVNPVERRRLTVGYSSSVICSLWRESICMQHCVQLCTELQQWQGDRTGGCPEWHRNTAKGWFGTIRKLPWIWQRHIGEYVELAVVWYSA